MSAGTHLETWVINTINHNRRDYHMWEHITVFDNEYDLDHNGTPIHSTLDGKINNTNIPVEVKCHSAFVTWMSCVSCMRLSASIT